LGQGYGHFAAVPVDLYEHVSGAGVFRCQAPGFDRFTFEEW